MIILDEVSEPSFSYKTGSKGFDKYGFDVVIGNPPYVFARANFKQKEKDFYVDNYVSAKYQINTYLLFIEKSVNLLKWNGVYGLIITKLLVNGLLWRRIKKIFT